MFTTAIIVAAGKGERLNSKISKQFLNLDGKPILTHTLEKFQNSSFINEVIIVTKKDSVEYCQNEIVCKYQFNKVKKVISGGDRRQDSVYCGIKETNIKTDILLIHDGVRPFVTEEQISNIIMGAKKFNSCVLGVKAKDTIKICDDNDFIVQTPDRSKLWSIQTPQGFKFGLIKSAYEKAISENFEATDDALIIENLGNKVKVIEGSYFNIKITTREDLIFAKCILDLQMGLTNNLT